MQLSAESASTNNVPYETLISQWLEQVVLMEKTKAQMDTRDIMREKIDRDFLYFPIGATLDVKNGTSASWKVIICQQWGH